MRKNFYKLLDFHLESIKVTQIRGHSNFDSKKREEFRIKHGFTVEEVFAARNKVEKDGYIEKNYKNWDQITLEGYLFINNGGYSGKKNREQINYFFKILNISIVFLASIFAIWYAGFEIWKYYYGYVPPPCP